MASLIHQGFGGAVLRIDGGMVANDWLVQRLSDQLGAPVDRPVVTETTVLGAAYLAGLAVGICPSPDAFAEDWVLEKRFEPAVDSVDADKLYSGWKQAVARLLYDPEP